MDSEYPLVLVVWKDITATAGWEDPEEVEPIEVRTIGWLYSQNENTIKIGNSLGEDDRPYGISALPTGCVVSMTTLCVSEVRTEGQLETQLAPSSQLPSPTPIHPRLV